MGRPQLLVFFPPDTIPAPATHPYIELLESFHRKGSPTHRRARAIAGRLHSLSLFKVDVAGHVDSRPGPDPLAGESPSSKMDVRRLYRRFPGVSTASLTFQPTASSTRVLALRPVCEWRFQVSHGSSVIVKVLSGTAEKDGVELAPRNAYNFSGVKSKILTWHGCELEIDGRCDSESIADYGNPTENVANSHLNLHGQLNDMRQAAARDGREGPRVLITGGVNTGKTTLARTLTSYATRQGYQPLVVNADPKEGLLSLPGTLSASVLATVMDPEAVDGWGSTPTSGPSSVPVKLPLVFYYGLESPEEDPDFYRELVSKLAGSVSGRLNEDENVKNSGVIIDGTGLPEQTKDGFDLVAHIVDEFSSLYSHEPDLEQHADVVIVNVIIVVGSSHLGGELTKRFASERTSLGEPISVVPLDKSDGVVERDEMFMQHAREAAIKEYFFGDSRRTLSPLIQQVDFDNVVVYHTPERMLDP